MPSTEDENLSLNSSEDLELSNLFASIQNNPQESVEREDFPEEFKRVSVIIKNPQKEKEGDKNIHEVSVLEKNILPTINIDEFEATGINEVFNNINLLKDQEDDNLICKYIHKKFRKLELYKQREIPQSSSDRWHERLPPEGGISHLYQSMSLSSKHTQFMDSLYLSEMNQTFSEAFSAVNLGEEVMVAYIDFCQRKSDGDSTLTLDPSFYFNCNQQITKKFLNFVSEFDFINLAGHKLYKILKMNLPRFKSLFYVFQYNSPSVEEELKLGKVKTRKRHISLLQY